MIFELLWLSCRRIQQEWGVFDEVMCDLVNVGVVELVVVIVEYGVFSEVVCVWWGNFLV